MSSIAQDKPTLNRREKLFLQLTRERILELAGITAILLLAAWLRFTNLNSLGYVNHYYTAGIKSMLQSWHNFFFVAAEPGGSVTIDKPPVGLWLQLISAYFLGVNGFGVLLPELLAGTISVAVLYHLVRRTFGILPGVIAALALAITPIVVATDRNNTIDSTLILTLLLATWAFFKATETGKMRFLLLGVTLVGIGFNIKMLQAYLPLPAFYALYFLGSSEKIWRKIGKLSLATVLLLAISLSWSLAVDLTPASQRPYVGSSSNNSELNLIVGYNGAQRLLGMFGRGGSRPGPGGFPGARNNGQRPQMGNSPAFPRGGNNSNGFPPPGNTANGNNFPPNGPDGGAPFNRPGGNAMRPGGGAGGMNIRQPGALRLFIAPLSKEVSWLLPFGLISIILLAAGSRWRWPIHSRHQALVLWGGWLITCVVFFSIAGFFHEYYLSMLAAPLAALVAIGIGELWNLAKTKPWISAGISSIAALATITFQIYTANSFTQNIWWLPAVVIIFLLGLLVMMVPLLGHKDNRGLLPGFALISIAMLITPLIWSVYTTLSASQNQSLPSSYSGGAIGPVMQRDIRINESLLDYLQANTQNIKYLMAVPSSMQGADYVIATGRPVLYMGGFNGNDPVVTADTLAKMVKNGQLRYIYWNAGGRRMETNSEISSWVTSSCTAVQGFDTATQNVGAPDGTMANQNGPAPQSFGGPQGDMQVSLYDCASSR
jgi:4-amino-4-deoxy-L-arabinose transferase-like glycosyltransferase